MDGWMDGWRYVCLHICAYVCRPESGLGDAGALPDSRPPAIRSRARYCCVRSYGNGEHGFNDGDEGTGADDDGDDAVCVCEDSG